MDLPRLNTFTSNVEFAKKIVNSAANLQLKDSAGETALRTYQFILAFGQAIGS